MIYNSVLPVFSGNLLQVKYSHCTEDNIINLYEWNPGEQSPSPPQRQEVTVLSARAHCGSYLEGLVLFGVYFPGL